MNLNVVKGLLILLVIVDHNDFSRSLFPGFLLGMTFHVVGFMTIPFLKPAVAPSALGAYAFRLFWPFLLLTCAMWGLVTLLENTPLLERLGLLGLALYSGNADALKAATRMGLLWFLPSFISLVALRSWLSQCRASVRAGALALLVALHLVLGMVALAIQQWVPAGLLPALYIWPLAAIGASMQRSLFAPLRPAVATALALALFGTAKMVQMAMGLDTEVGFSVVADIRHPLALLVNDLEAVCGTLMLFQIARWDFAGLLAAFGKVSMQIYLCHAFIGLAIYQGVLRFAPHFDPLVAFIGSVCTTALLSLALARLALHTPLIKRLVFPRDPAELLGARASVPQPR